MVSVSGDGRTILSGGPIDNSGAGAAWVFYNPTTGVDPAVTIPAAVNLDQNYPNPFNPMTTVSFQLPAVSDVRLVVYDVLGREAAVLVDERKPAGEYRVRFDASALSSGVYFLKINARGAEPGSGVREFATVRKMVLAK
jgi:hypothetical protein